MKTKQIINSAILLCLSACFGGEIRGLGGSHNGNPDSKTYADDVLEQHCVWVDFCAGDISYVGCVDTQQDAIKAATKEIKDSGLEIDLSRYENISCSTVSDSFNQFIYKNKVLKFWRKEAFINPVQ